MKNNIIKDDTRTHEVKIRLSNTEYELIKSRAARDNMKVAPYIRRELLKPASYQIQPKAYSNICNQMQHIINKYNPHEELTEDFELLYSTIREVYHGNT